MPSNRAQPPTLEDHDKRWAERVGWRMAKSIQQNIENRTGRRLNDAELEVVWGVVQRALLAYPPDPIARAKIEANKEMRRRRRRMGLIED